MTDYIAKKGDLQIRFRRHASVVSVSIYKVRKLINFELTIDNKESLRGVNDHSIFVCDTTFYYIILKEFSMTGIMCDM